MNDLNISAINDDMMWFDRIGYNLSKQYHKKIALLLKKEREERGFKLEELAKILNIPMNKLQKMERGETRPNWHLMAMLLTLYNKHMEITLEPKSNFCYV